LSQKNSTPFDALLGCYILPMPIRHNKITQKSFLFVGDGWKEIGDIEFLFIPVTEDSGYIEVNLPDPQKYAAEHKDEGAEDWLRWGAGVN